MFLRFAPARYKVVVFINSAGAWQHRIVSLGNNKKIQTSEVYSSRSEALETAGELARNAGWRLEIEDF